LHCHFSFINLNYAKRPEILQSVFARTGVRGNALKSKEIKRRRIERGLTQEDLAELLGVNITTVYRWETGAYLPA
jgi:DNA-binding transcriptional regulator YiaG